MELVYFKGSVPNFGDELNKSLWPTLAPRLFEKEATVGQTDNLQVGFLGIGTIIGMPTPKHKFLHVFSSGVGYDSLGEWRIPRHIWCVRGPLSAQTIGAEPKTAITDGALLTPIAFDLAKPKPGPGGTGVMPHWESLVSGGWEQACKFADMQLISPLGDPLDVIKRIMTLDLLVTESLHGAILADTLGLPWIPFASSGNFSVFKWSDWTASMGLRPSVPGVSPPNATAALRFGRPKREALLGADAAIVHFNAPTTQRTPGRRFMGIENSRNIVKKLLLSSPNLANALLSFSPSRTAEALTRISTRDPSASSPSLRSSLSDRMLSLLRQVEQSQ